MSPVIVEKERTVKTKQRATSRGGKRSSRLIVISADGMRPDFYRCPDEFGLKIPNLRRLVQTGASADAVESIYPSTTYPAHATLATGVRPNVHGVYSHLAARDPTQPARPWHWYSRALKVPALWDAARAAGLKTAGIGWPVSAGAAIDYNIPEIWDPAAPDPHRDFETARRHSTPEIAPKVLEAVRPIFAVATPDRLRAEVTLYVWKNYRPDLLLMHFVYYDLLAHEFGPLSPQALVTLEDMDKEIGRIRKAAENDSATLVVLSDHGFVPVEKEAAPLAILTEEGLFDRNTNHGPQMKRLGAISAGGSFAIYWTSTPTTEDRQALARAVERLQGTGAVQETLNRERLQALGADPDAELILDAAPGFYFSDRFEGPAVRATVKDRGTHGHLPSRPGLEASFLGAGRGIRARKNLGRISLTEVAPTLARLLGLPAGALASRENPIDLG